MVILDPKHSNWTQTTMRSLLWWTIFLWSYVLSNIKTLSIELTKLNFRFVLVDLPAEEHAGSWQMYSLNAAPLHLPNFWFLWWNIQRVKVHSYGKFEWNMCQFLPLGCPYSLDISAWTQPVLKPWRYFLRAHRFSFHWCIRFIEKMKNCLYRAKNVWQDVQCPWQGKLCRFYFHPGTSIILSPILLFGQFHISLINHQKFSNWLAGNRVVLKNSFWRILVEEFNIVALNL